MRRRPWRVCYHSAEEMPEVEDATARIVIASPPFTNSPDGKSLDKADYLRFIQVVFSEACRVLSANGVLVTVNTDLRDHARYNRGDRRFDGLLWQKHCDLRAVAESVGFLCVDTKIWVKSLKRNLYRYAFAYVQIFKKDSRTRYATVRLRTREEFGPDVWVLDRGTHRQQSRGPVFRDAIHPGIVERCLEQFTRSGDLIVSPFAGSGTVLSVANLMGRRSIGYEINTELRPLIEASISVPEQFPAYVGCLTRYGKVSRRCKRRTD